MSKKHRLTCYCVVHEADLRPNHRTRVFDKFCILPRVLELNDYFLDEGYMVSAVHSIQINPGEKAQQLHHGE